MADEKYAVKGIAGSSFRDALGTLMLVLRMNSMKTWVMSHLYCRGARLTQSLASLFHTLAPTLTISQEQWNVLLLSPETGRRVFQYPPTLGSVGACDYSSVTCIAFCILAVIP
jgi:hypothetical protein